jgi:periplasmic protein CpxP/Spy
MKKVMARIAYVAMAVLISGTAFSAAQPGTVRRAQAFGPRRSPVEQALGAQGNKGRWWNNPRISEQLKLTDDQRKAMDQILYDHRAKLIDLHANLEKAELAMQQLMSADQPDQKAMEAQIDKVVAARGDLERANSRFLLDIRMKLTPDQWKQLRDSRGMGMQAPADHGKGPMQEFRNRRNGDGPPTPAGAPPAPPTDGQGQGQGAGPGAGMDQ